MHSRKKKIDEIVDANKIKAREKKIQVFQAGMSRVFELRSRSGADYSDDMLTLCEQLLLANPDVYTLWNIRKEILCRRFTIGDAGVGGAVEISIDAYKAEMNLTEQCLRVNQKSYGAWYHRQWVFKRTPFRDGKHELGVCNAYLELDGRNFHCWDYRRFIVQETGVDLASELEYTKSLIEANMSNYSSWYYRSKLLPVVHPSKDVCDEGNRSASNINQDMLREEYELVQNAIFTDSNDSSAWFYLNWLLTSHFTSNTNRIIGVYYHCTSKQLAISTQLPIDKVDGVLPVKLTIASAVCGDLDWFNPSLGCECASCVWVCNISDIEDKEVAVELFGSSHSPIVVSVVHHGAQGVVHQINKDTLRCMIRPDVEQRITELLDDVGESCCQLLEFEPENKWCSLLLMEIDHRRQRRVQRDHLDKLMTGSGYYEDLLSKVTMEGVIMNKLSEGKMCESKLDLSGMSLTRVFYMNCYIHVIHVDVSGNKLTSLSGVECLLWVETLNVSSNNLTSLQPLTNTTTLSKLDVSNNIAFTSVQPVLQFVHCTKSKSFTLTVSDNGDVFRKELDAAAAAACEDVSVNIIYTK